MRNVLAICVFVFASTRALAEPVLGDLAFLEGHWRGGDDFTFEEIWSGADGGVMTGMARGVSGGTLQVLEYIVVSQETGAVVMRFKHYNADFSTWEDGEPVTLILGHAEKNDVTFTADPPSETVKSIRYWQPDAHTLQADIVLIEDGEEGGFSLSFEKVN